MLSCKRMYAQIETTCSILFQMYLELANKYERETKTSYCILYLKLVRQKSLTKQKKKIINTQH